MKKLKKPLKITAITLLILTGLLFAAPLLFKGKIITLVKEEINKNLNAKADFRDVSISFFRHFPRVSVALKGLQVVGVGEFAADTLVSAKEIDVSLDIMSFFRGSNMKIYSVNIAEPRIHAIVHKNGKVNWDIMKKDSQQKNLAAQDTTFTLNLNHYSIRNGYVNYLDESSNMKSEIINLDHEGSGDFNADLFTLVTQTTADDFSFSYNGIPYLSKTKTSIDADIQVDNKTNKYSFNTDKVLLNDLKLLCQGFFQLINDSTYNMDIAFEAPSTDFKKILSLVPMIYQKDFASVKASGQTLFNGFVKGVYKPSRMPAYNISLDIKNGFFQYPDLPKPVKNINLILEVDNRDGIADHSVIHIPKGHLEIDNDPFDFRLLIKNPVTDMFVDAAAKGKLDLSKISQLVKLESGTKLGGLLNADVLVNGKVAAIEKQQFEQFNAWGTIDLHNFFYSSKNYPDGVTLNNLLASFNSRNVTITELNGRYMKTNFSANGTINNLLAYAMKNSPLDAELNAKADYVNLDKWMGISTDTTTRGTKAAEPFVVPGNIKFVVNANVDKLHYDKIDIEDLSGSLQVANETVWLMNVKGKALEGTMNISGSYSTKVNKKKPDIALVYDVKDLDVQKTFYAFNTVQKLMPIGQFIAGKLNSQLSFTGKLGDNMTPDLSSLTGAGNLLLIQGFLSKFKPLEQMAQTLKLKELSNFSLRDVKNHIEFANGKVLVKPFKLSVKGIDMEIGGMHGFDQSIDYVINMKLPRSLVGEKGNQFVNNLVTQVSNKTMPIALSDNIPLQVKMGGTIKNPVIKTDLRQTTGTLAEDLEQQATDFVKQKIDSTRQAVTKAVKDTAESMKKQLVKDAEEELKKQLLGKKDSVNVAGLEDTKKKAAETGKGLLNNLMRKKKKGK